jgi:hypothetical protein
VRCGAVRCGAVRCGAVRCGAVQALHIERAVIEEVVQANPTSTIMAVMDRLVNWSTHRSTGFSGTAD